MYDKVPYLEFIVLECLLAQRFRCCDVFDTNIDENLSCESMDPFQSNSKIYIDVKKRGNNKPHLTHFSKARPSSLSDLSLNENASSTLFRNKLTSSDNVLL